MRSISLIFLTTILSSLKITLMIAMFAECHIGMTMLMAIEGVRTIFYRRHLSDGDDRRYLVAEEQVENSEC
ncbi:MAG: hypothetical protein R2865_14235 [Deinococcales bacterium]